MPQLDVSDILTDADFCETGIVCLRNSQVVGENGIAVNTPQAFKFSGVVTSISGANLRRTADGEFIYGDISIITRFRLQDGKTGFTADTIQRHGRTYTVVDVQDYRQFGRGFVECRCDLTSPLAG